MYIIVAKCIHIPNNTQPDSCMVWDTERKSTDIHTNKAILKAISEYKGVSKKASQLDFFGYKQLPVVQMEGSKVVAISNKDLCVIKQLCKI